MTPQEFWHILNQAPHTPATVFRLYHNDQGDPIEYSMDHKPGKYIDITAEQYFASSFKVKVVDHKLTQLPNSIPLKLVPSEHGTHCAVTDVSVVVSNTPYQAWTMKHD